MKTQYVTDLPFGYDERTTMTLGPQNQIIIAHPVMPPLVYDEQVMKWVEVDLNVAEPQLLKPV